MEIKKIKLFCYVLILLSLTSQAQTVSESQSCRVGLTLSGGAARGYAHIGVIRAFEEAGIEIDYISGSSMGAIIGLFYATGKTPDEILEIAKNIKKGQLMSFGPLNLRNRGLDYLEQIINEHITEKTFEQLKKPLLVCATNYHSGRYEIMAHGEILPAIRATAAIPIMYRPQIIDGVAYIDGGVVNNLPVEPLRERCHIVVGISVNPIEYKNENLNIRNQISRVAQLMLNENEARRIEKCDYHLEITELRGVDFDAYEQSEKIHDIGYRAAKEFITNNPGISNFTKKYFK